MTTAPEPSGRRDNGLTCGEWGALVDLDPRLSDTLLGSLGAVGVAAYVEPAHGVDSFSRAVALPQRPLDRLWVDPSRADEARAVVAAEIADLASLLAADEPGTSVTGFIQPVPRTAATRVLAPPVLPTSTDPDEQAWQQIVEGWTADTSDTPVPRWPVTEDLDPAEAAEPAESTRRRRRPPSDAEDEAALPAWLEPEALEDDGHYVPPPPPPIPRVRRHTVGAVVCLALGLVLTFAPQLVGQVATGELGVVGVLLMVGGAGALVWQVRDAPPTDRGTDDGAVV